MTHSHQRSLWIKTAPILSLSVLSFLSVLTPVHAQDITTTPKDQEIAALIQSAQPGQKIPVTDKIIVTMTEDLPAEKVSSTVDDALKNQLVNVESVPKETVAGDTKKVVVELDDTLNEKEQQEVITTLEKDPAIQAAEPDFIVKAIASTSEPSYGRQWALHPGYLNAPPAWAKGLNGSGTTLGIVDTGYTWHPDLTAPVAQYDFISDVSMARDGNGRDSSAVDVGTGNVLTDSHGLHVQGIAAAKANGIGVAGVAPNASIVHARALGLQGAGLASDILDAAWWTIGGSVPGVPNNPKPANVLNLSLSWPGTCSASFQNLMNEADRRGVVTVVAAGNTGQPAINHTPGNCANVITVGATTSWNALASYSNHGWAVDVVAPGGTTGAGIYSTLNTGSWSVGQPTYGDKNGTSMATPYVSGAALLMKQANPKLSAKDVKSILLSTSTPVAGYKQINIDKATSEAQRRAAHTKPAAPTYSLKPGSGIEAGYYRFGGVNQFGLPISNEFPLIDGGFAQNFAKNQTIYWTNQHGAYPVHFSHGIGQKYVSGGYEKGYGFPIAEEVSISGGAVQKFRKANGSQTSLYWASHHQRTHSVWEGGAIGQKFNASGGTARLGFPAEDETLIHNGARQIFTTPTSETRIYWSPTTGARTINGRGAIFDKWVKLNGLNTLGFPSTDELPAPQGGAMQHFISRDGSKITGIWWTQATGAHALNLRGAIANYWMRSGYVNTFGYPTTSEVTASDGSVSVKFSKGKTITWKPNGHIFVR